MSTENQTPDPTNVSELARETARKVNARLHINELYVSMIALEVQSALSKLAAEKDAEFQRRLDNALVEQRHHLCKESDELREEVDRVRQVGREALTDLARHVAALKVARDALDTIASFPTGQEASGDTCSAVAHAIFALQRIDKELKP